MMTDLSRIAQSLVEALRTRFNVEINVPRDGAFASSVPILGPCKVTTLAG